MGGEAHSILRTIDEISTQADLIFSQVDATLRDQSSATDRVDYFWNQLSIELQSEAHRVINEVLELGKRLARACKQSLLTTDADLVDVQILVKKMRASLLLRSYDYQPPEVLHDEGTVLGFQRASQEERYEWPRSAKRTFADSVKEIRRIAELCEVEQGDAASPLSIKEANKYRPNTAFIIMWMNKEEPVLEDVRDAVKEVFDEFGIKAVRADDIEHEGLITQRILDEIRSTEFLFADLTGQRPNVYYEVGYAHALGKRVILFRDAKTALHFDLAGYNCPEYRNLGDLKEQLRRRLAALTNKKV